MINILIPITSNAYLFDYPGIKIVSLPVVSWVDIDLSKFDVVAPLNNAHYNKCYELNLDISTIPSKEIFNMFLDKKEYLTFFKSKGLERYFPEQNPINYPKIIKPAKGDHSDGVMVVSESGAKEQGIVEEYLYGVEYSSDIIFSKDKGIISSYTIRYPETDIRKIDSSSRLWMLHTNRIQYVRLDKRHKDQIEEVLSTANVNGLININFKVKDIGDRVGTIKIFDINPSWSGTSELHTNKIMESLSLLKDSVIA